MADFRQACIWKFEHDENDIRCNNGRYKLEGTKHDIRIYDLKHSKFITLTVGFVALVDDWGIHKKDWNLMDNKTSYNKWNLESLERLKTELEESENELFNNLEKFEIPDNKYRIEIRKNDYSNLINKLNKNRDKIFGFKNGN